MNSKSIPRYLINDILSSRKTKRIIDYNNNDFSDLKLT